MYSVQLPYALKNCLPLILSFGLIVPSSRVVKQNVYKILFTLCALGLPEQYALGAVTDPHKRVSLTSGQSSRCPSDPVQLVLFTK